MKYASAILILVLAGCAVSAQTRSASVNVDVLLRQHPLYGTLAQYDRQIAALQATLHTQFANSGAQIENANAAVRRDLNDASAAASRTSVTVRYRTTPSLSRGIAPTSTQIASTIQSNYREQHAQLQDAARRDMGRYRFALLAQQQSAYAAFVDSVNDRTQRAYDARAQELREKEGTLLLDFSRKYASQRLTLRAQLQTLALRADQRKLLQHELAVFQKREDKAYDAMRATDARILVAYSALLRARADSDIAKMQSDLQSRTAANLAARERVLAAQTTGTGNLQLPASTTRAGSASEMQAQYDALANAQPADSGAFANARDDLATRFKQLHDTDADNTAGIRSQIGWLQHDRNAVRKRMIAQIMLEADREAKARGLAYASDSYHAARDSVDVTSAVAADLKSLSP